jgi:hypothetical protein
VICVTRCVDAVCALLAGELGLANVLPDDLRWSFVTPDNVIGLRNRDLGICVDYFAFVTYHPDPLPQWMMQSAFVPRGMAVDDDGFGVAGLPAELAGLNFGRARTRFHHMRLVGDTQVFHGTPGFNLVFGQPPDVPDIVAVHAVGDWGADVDPAYFSAAVRFNQQHRPRGWIGTVDDDMVRHVGADVSLQRAMTAFLALVPADTRILAEHYSVVIRPDGVRVPVITWHVPNLEEWRLWVRNSQPTSSEWARRATNVTEDGWSEYDV